MASSVCLLLGMRLINSNTANMNSMDTASSRIRKWILYSHVHFLNVLASLLSCMRTRLCSADGVAVLAPQLSRLTVPGDRGRLFGLALCPEAIQLETHHPAPVTAASNGQLWFKLIIAPGFTVSTFTLQREFSLWDCTAETKGRSTLYPTTEKGLLQVSYLSKVVSHAASLVSPAPLTNFLPPLLYLGKCRNIASISLLSQMRFLSSLLKQFSPRSAKSGWVSGPVFHEQCFWFLALPCTRALSSLTFCHLPHFCLPPCSQHLSLFVAILLFLFQRHWLSLCNSLLYFLLTPYHALFKPHLHTSLHVPSPFLCQWLNSCISLGHFSHILPTLSDLSAWTPSPLNEDGKVKLHFFAQWMFPPDNTTNHLSINLACK